MAFPLIWSCLVLPSLLDKAAFRCHPGSQWGTERWQRAGQGAGNPTQPPCSRDNPHDTSYLPAAPTHCPPSPQEGRSAHVRGEIPETRDLPRGHRTTRAGLAGGPGHQAAPWSASCPSDASPGILLKCRSNAVGVGWAPNISELLPGPRSDAPVSVSLPGLFKDSSQSLVRGTGLRGRGGCLAWGAAAALGARGQSPDARGTPGPALPSSHVLWAPAPGTRRKVTLEPEPEEGPARDQEGRSVPSTPD